MPRGKKCLEVAPETWRRVMIAKYELGFRSVDQLLEYLLRVKGGKGDSAGDLHKGKGC